MVYLPRMADAPDLTGKHILSPTAPTTCWRTWCAGA